MNYKEIIVVALASIAIAQDPGVTPPKFQNNLPTPAQILTIATAQPAPGDLAASIVSEASMRASSISSAAQSQFSSITNSIASEASQISSKLSSISSNIDHPSGSPHPSSTSSDNVAPIQTGVMALGALLGAGAILANF